MIRATDAKEVGVENPAEETFCYPNRLNDRKRQSHLSSGVLERFVTILQNRQDKNRKQSIIQQKEAAGKNLKCRQRELHADGGGLE